MDVVTPRHPRRPTVDPARCSTPAPTRSPAVGPSGTGSRFEACPAYSTKRDGVRTEGAHLDTAVVHGGAMCGIAGFWDRFPERMEVLEDRVVSMTDTLRHRGPDDAGSFVDAEAGIALGSRRLAIIDLSAHGHQPMESSDGRYVVSYNGEIYNFAALRADLEGLGHRFRGSSDTEVLVASVQHRGVRDTLVRCNGMFGLAVWDRRDRQLHLARDRFGEKPLYYGWAGSVFLFGSELKALRAHPAFRADVDRDVLALYFRHNCVPAPYSIFKGIAQLRP